MSNTQSEVVRVIDLIPGALGDLAEVKADALDPATFWNEHVLRHRPVVIRGAAAAWPALEKWQDPEYLSASFGEQSVSLHRTFNALPLSLYEKGEGKVTLPDALRTMRAGRDDETFSIPHLRIPDQLGADLGAFACLSGSALKPPRVYARRRIFVYRNASTEWHYHHTDETLTSQILGRKRFSLVRLSRENWDTVSDIVRVNAHHLKNVATKRLQAAKLVKFECVLSPGDTVYIPPFWWHGVDPVDTGLGITLADCFATPLTRIGSWNEPVVRAMMQNMWRARAPLQMLVTAGLVTASSLRRAASRDPW